MTKEHTIAQIATTGHQQQYLKLSLSGAPSPALLSSAIKGTITDPANKTKTFAHLLMAEGPNTATTSSKERRKETRWNKRCLFNGNMHFDWKSVETIQDSNDTVIDMVLQQRPGECGAPTAGVLKQAEAAYLEMEARESQETETEEIEQGITTAARAFSWSDLGKPTSLF